MNNLIALGMEVRLITSTFIYSEWSGRKFPDHLFSIVDLGDAIAF